MQGASPLASPALDRLRHLQSLLSRCPAGGCSPCGTCSPCPGGEDHLKRRSSSPPIPPLLGWRHCPEDRISVGFASNWRRRRLTPRSNTGLAGRASAARVQPRECKGRSPLHENNLSPPPSRREGGRGDRGEKSIIWQEKQARQDTAPRRVPGRQLQPVPRGFSHGDARGEAPCIRKLKVSPFPPGRGLGGWGQ